MRKSLSLTIDIPEDTENTISAFVEQGKRILDDVQYADAVDGSWDDKRGVCEMVIAVTHFPNYQGSDFEFIGRYYKKNGVWKHLPYEWTEHYGLHKADT